MTVQTESSKVTAGMGGIMLLTFVAVSHRIKVHIILIIADEEQAQPRVKGINWYNKQDADDVALLVGDSVGP